MRVKWIQEQPEQIGDMHDGPHPDPAMASSLAWLKPAPASSMATQRLALRFREEVPVSGRIEMTWAGWRYSAAREEWSVVVTAETDRLRHAEWARFKAAWNGRAPDPPSLPGSLRD